MVLIFWILVFIFIVKLVGNLILPYCVLRLKEGEGISAVFIILLDFVLILILIMLSWWIKDSNNIFRIKNSLLVFGGSLMITYIHYFIILTVGYFLRKK